MSLVSKGDRVAIKSGTTCQIKSELLQMNRTGTYSPVLLSMILSVSMSMSRSAGAPSSPNRLLKYWLMGEKAVHHRRTKFSAHEKSMPYKCSKLLAQWPHPAMWGISATC